MWDQLVQVSMETVAIVVVAIAVRLMQYLCHYLVQLGSKETGGCGSTNASSISATSICKR